MIETCRRKGTFNAWVVKVLKGHTRAIRHFYYIKDIDRGYRLEMARREKNQALKYTSNMPRELEAKMSINERKKGNNDWEKFRYKITNNSREALLWNTLWYEAIAKGMTTLERLGVFQFY